MRSARLAATVAVFGALILGANAQVTGFGGSYSLNNDGTGSAVIVNNNTLQLTDANTYGEANSVYYNTKQNVSAFTASFTYTLAAFNSGDGYSPADGFTFVVQNDSLNALGIAGADLGYSNSQNPSLPAVQNSVAIAFNIYQPNGLGENLLTNGNNPFSYNATAPVNLIRGDPINVLLSYSNGQLLEKLTDANFPSQTYTHLYTGIDIPGTVGGSDAWIGFTAANSAGSGTQDITNFSFTPSATPEPVTISMLVGGIAVAFVQRRRVAP